MNVQRLIEKYKKLEGVWDAEGAELARQIFLQDLQQLDEPQKPVIPQFVAKWIEYCKNTNVAMKYALVIGEVFFYNYANQNDFSKLKEFLETENNQETFARAWLFGYEVEKEAKYTVKVKATKQYLCNDELGPHFSPSFRSNFTKTNLEELGFGWVFSCEGVEIEEV